MEKKLFLAVSLSILILISWSAFVNKKPQTIEPKLTELASSSQVIENTSVTSKNAIQEVVVEENPTEETPFALSFGKQDLAFLVNSAAIHDATLHDYQSDKFILSKGFKLDQKDSHFQIAKQSEGRIGFVQSDKAFKINKDFIFDKEDYYIELEITLQNMSNLERRFDLPIILGRLDFNGDPNEARFKDVTVGLANKTIHPNARKDATFAGAKFLALRDRYFTAIISPESFQNYSCYVKKINNKESEVGLIPDNIVLSPNAKIIEKFRIYLGPQDLKTIAQINPEWGAVIYYGTFDWIGHMLLQLLDFLHGIVHNWGLAIILLSFIIFLILYPLTAKQMRSMKEMQVLQPKVEALRATYKDNPQKLNKEIMQLYREHKVNPLGGCLPLLLQIPIFIALYQALIRSVALKGASFLWIKDLSGPDKLFTLPTNLPLLGNEFNLLPILMAIEMFVQQKLTMTSATAGSSAEQQKIMLIVMPILFGVIFYHMPAGLVLYWFMNSTLMLISQLRSKRSI